MKGRTRPMKAVNRDEEHRENRPGSRMGQLVGFELSDLRSFDSFVRLCHKPVDAASLSAFRIAYGFLMVIDCFDERGFSKVVTLWSNEYEVCHFPLFDFMKPLPLPWMVMVYLVMLTGAVGITLGLFFRVSCLLHLVTYWFIFLLEKTHWNNHSYLFGLISLMLLLTDANRYWSLDGWLNPSIQNVHVPVWNYGLLRYQIFLVYFIAGLKKLDRDWVQGYSMASLSHQSVFDPFRYFLSADEIDQYVVHWGGLAIDLTAGFLLFFDATRHLGAAMVTSFHGMNAQMFSIGEFPYVMLCSTAIFYPYDWPKKILPKKLHSLTKPKPSPHCLCSVNQRSYYYHKVMAVVTVVFACWQTSMPYSHCLTKGYNSWAGGLYGYSWDMMVHNWNTQHIKIKYMSRSTREEGYLEPMAFVRTERWAMQPDMMRQHARCIAELLDVEYDIPNVAVYMDIWQSINKRFQQRIVNPNIDLVTAPWSPFKPASYLLPLLNDLESWREKLVAITQETQASHLLDAFDNPDVTFLADFPGMVLENFVNEDLGRTNITLLSGSALLMYEGSRENISLQFNQPVRLRVGTHSVYVTSDIPACYMYTYSNTTEVELERQLKELEVKISQNSLSIDQLRKTARHNKTLQRLLIMHDEKESESSKINAQQGPSNYFNTLINKVEYAYNTVKSSLATIVVAFESLVTGKSMLDLLESL